MTYKVTIRSLSSIKTKEQIPPPYDQMHYDIQSTVVMILFSWQASGRIPEPKTLDAKI
jgi:hypothetical protein